MSFLTRDLVPAAVGRRQALRLRDWALLLFFAAVTWMISATCAWLAGAAWIPANFLALFPVGGVVFLCIGSWWYPAIANLPPRILVVCALQFFVVGAIVFGFELHAGSWNAYEVLVHGVPSGAHWGTRGFPWGELIFVAAYAFVLTALRRQLWLALDARRDGKS